MEALFVAVHGWLGSFTIPAMSIITTLALAWSRKLPNSFLRVWFMGTMLVMALWLGIVCNIIRLIYKAGLLSHARFQTLLPQAAAFSMHVHQVLNPQVRMIQAPGSMNWADICGPHILMTNHTSFFDLFGGLWIVPLKYMGIVRIFFKGSLAKTPVLGPMFLDAGMFPVHYTSTNYEDFSVERGKQAEVMQNVEAYLQRGGALMLAPEGVVNRNPTQLTEFRVGSFNLLTKFKLPLYYIVYCGNDEVWPARQNVGGNAADVVFYIGKVNVDYSEGSPDTDAKALSLKLKGRMQQVLDYLYRERAGIVAGTSSVPSLVV